MTFTARPNPPIKGEHITVCFDFPADMAAITAVITYDVPGDADAVDEVVLTPREPCATRWVPENATWYTITDSLGMVPPLTGAVA